MRNETHMWVLGLYKLSWPANGSFVAIRNFFSFVFFFCGCCCFLFLFSGYSTKVVNFLSCSFL